MSEKIVNFFRAKAYKLVKEIGQGGTGRTVLLRDELINEQFVCKKYSPFYPEHKQDFYSNFKDEIKLLHLLYHQNIVRVFNYYLYPEEFTGYILMEYIEGSSISEYLKINPDKLNSIFAQTISGFAHLEKTQILHRDIRPSNILVTNDGVVKIIDFGFSKHAELESDYNKSITLGWIYDTPNEFANKIYDFRTELYFVGKLFEDIIIANNFQNFAYKETLKGMLSIDYNKQTHSFFDLSRSMIKEGSGDLNFNEDQKAVYRKFADDLAAILVNIDVDSAYKSNLDEIMIDLKRIYNDSILEDVVQNPSRIPKCFISGNYVFWKNHEIEVETLKSFINFIETISKEKRKVVINNLWQRLDRIERNEPSYQDDLPF